MPTLSPAETRALVLARTEDLRADWEKTQERLREIDAEIAKIHYPCASLTRLGDQRWDVSARLSTLARKMDAICNEVAADNS